jgi:dipeptidyl aminopeptidase/acylaminoacyl peptidase
MSQINKSVKAENDPHIFKEVRAFLKVLNSGTGKPIEQLSPADARKVLVDAQNSVTVDCTGIEESEKTITEDGETIRIHIVKPIGVNTNAPVFIFIHGG